MASSENVFCKVSRVKVSREGYAPDMVYWGTGVNACSGLNNGMIPVTGGKSFSAPMIIRKRGNVASG